jgi:hypothetical protein
VLHDRAKDKTAVSHARVNNGGYVTKEAGQRVGAMLGCVAVTIDKGRGCVALHIALVMLRHRYMHIVQRRAAEASTSPCNHELLTDARDY